MMQDQSGQTLMEVIVAIAILTFAMVAAVSLATTTIQSSTEAGRRDQATALGSREMESLRSLRDALAERRNDQNQTLYTYLRNEGSALFSGDCFYFGIQQANNDIGWQTVGASSPDSFIRYSASDFANPGNFKGYSNFSRIVRLCTAQDFYVRPSTDGTYKDSRYMYDVEVEVTWEEADDESRYLTFRNALITPGDVDDQ